MALNKFIKGAKSVTEAAQKTIDKVNPTGITQGFLGNYTELTEEEAKTYSTYLMEAEEIVQAFKLVRDVMIFTDKRIIFFDKQGATGMKMSVESINLYSITSVMMETSGFGFDDSELVFEYITTPYLRAHQLNYAKKKLEFPKRFDVQSLYVMLQTLAFENCNRLNQ